MKQVVISKQSGVRFMKLVGLIFISSIFLNACTSPYASSCWEKYKTKNEQAMDDGKVVGKYVLDKEAVLFQDFKSKVHVEPIIELMADHSFVATHFVDFDRNFILHNELHGSWKSGLSIGNDSNQVVMMDFGTFVPGGYYYLSTQNDDLVLVHVVGDPDSCNGVVYRKLK
jgi:hypothetical protein